MRQTSIFLSHTGEEAELALLLKDVVVQAFPDGVQVYVSSDGNSVRAGDKWLADLEAMLKRSSLHLVLCSRASIRRPWVNFEAGAAWVTDTPTVPVCHSGMRPDLLPLPLNTFQGVLLSGPNALRGILDSIAKIVRQDFGPIDLDYWAGAIRDQERRLSAAASGHRIVRMPKVLCGTIAEYSDSFAKDIRIVSSAFANVTVRTDLDCVGLVHLLSTENFDVLHLFLPVLPDSGDVVFQLLENYEGCDRLAAAAFRELAEGCGASLVVLATCKAVLLAIQVAPVCNMIACDIAIDEVQIERWMRLFYPMLGSGRVVSSAHRLATQSSSVPMYHLRGDEVAFGGLSQDRPAVRATTPPERTSTR